MFLLHSSFHTQFESRFLQIDHQIKLSCRSGAFTVGITLPTPKCRSCRSEGRLSLQTSSFILPIGVSLKNALFQPKTNETLLGSTWIICPRHEESLNQFFSCKKRKSLDFFHMGLKHQFTWFLVCVEKKQRFFWRATKNFPWLQKYIPVVSRPVRRWPDHLRRDVTVRDPPRLTLTFPFGIRHFQALSWRIKQGHLWRIPPTLLPQWPHQPHPLRKEVQPLKTNMTGWKNPPCSIGNESSNGGCFYCHVSFRGV